MPPTTAPAVTAIGTAASGSSGGFVAASSGPFHRSAGPGSTAGGSTGPTDEPPVKRPSIGSISTV